MKIAVVGKGNTGQAVIDLLGAENVTDIFDSKNVITVDKLNRADAVIIFVSGEVLDSMLHVLLNVQRPIICGTTGFTYSKELVQKINSQNSTWIVANNFSLSMVFIKDALSALGKINSLIPKAQYAIDEIHHTGKLDAPSGTALSWKEWINVKECNISSERLGDVKGIHKAYVNYDYESIELKHIANDRKLFAQGAIWAAKYAIVNNQISGFNQFEVLVKESVNEYK